MSSSPSSWTLESLREHLRETAALRDKYVDQRFDSQENAVRSALATAEKATDKAELAISKRFDSVNEFRGMVEDFNRTTMPRAEAEIRLVALEKAIAARTSEGLGAKVGWGWAVGVVGFALAIYSFVRR